MRWRFPTLSLLLLATPLAAPVPAGPQLARPLPRFTRHRPRHRRAQAAAPLPRARNPPALRRRRCEPPTPRCASPRWAWTPMPATLARRFGPLVEREPGWPYAWHALAEAEMRRSEWQRAESTRAGEPGGHRRARAGARERATGGSGRPVVRTRRALARAAWHSDCATRPSSPPPGTRFVAPTRRSPQPPADLLLARGRLERAAGDEDSAAAVFARAGAAGGPSGALARLELARTRFATGAADGDSAYYEGVRGDDPAVLAAYRADLAPIAADSDLARFDAAGRRRAGGVAPTLLDRPRRRRASHRRASDSASTIGACSMPAGTSRSRSPAGSTGRGMPTARAARSWTTAARSTSAMASRRPASGRSSSASCPTRPGATAGPTETSCSTSAPATTPPAAATCTTIGWSRACSIFAARPRRPPTNCCSRASRSHRSTVRCSTGARMAAPSRAAGSAASGGRASTSAPPPTATSCSTRIGSRPTPTSSPWARATGCRSRISSSPSRRRRRRLRPRTAASPTPCGSGWPRWTESSTRWRASTRRSRSAWLDRSRAGEYLIGRARARPAAGTLGLAGGGRAAR